MRSGEGKGECQGVRSKVRSHEEDEEAYIIKEVEALTNCAAN